MKDHLIKKISHSKVQSSKALITGATGFIGSHLARQLVAGGWDVHLIIRPESRLTAIQDICERVTLHRHDGSAGGMDQIMKRAAPDVVFHLASLFLAQHEPQDIINLLQSNVVFATLLVDAMAANGAYQLVNTGTSWQHFQNQAYCPVCLYAATKQAFEAILTFYSETTPLKIVNLKLFDTYGPEDPRGKLFALLQKAVREQESLVMSPGEQLIDLVYIDDVVNALLVGAELLANNQITGQEDFAVSSQSPVRLRDLVEIYSRVIGKELKIQWGGRPYRPREVMIPWNRGKLLPGWKPQVSLEEGIQRIRCSSA